MKNMIKLRNALRKFSEKAKKSLKNLLKKTAKTWVQFFPGGFLGFLLTLTITIGFTGCAGDLKFSSKATTPTTNNLSDQNVRSEALIGAGLRFHFSDFFSLTEPNPNTSCAGDAKNFYHPFKLTEEGPIGALKLEESIVDPGTTIRPAFLKNVSLNLTDANAPVSSNLAQSCSLGSSASAPLTSDCQAQEGTNQSCDNLSSAVAPPVSHCSTFDFGAIGGLPTNLGGTLILIGGIQSTNYSGINDVSNQGHSMTCGPTSSSDALNVCKPTLFGLGLNTLPPSAAGTSYAPGLTSSDNSISIWNQFKVNSTSPSPRGAVGASTAMSSSLGKVLLYGGAAPLAGLNSEGFGATTSETWIFNVQDEKWTLVNSNYSISQSIQVAQDSLTQRIKSPGPRSLFGMVAMPGAALARLSFDGNMVSADVDTTDRIITIGGKGSCDFYSCNDTHKFNPTFGPEYFDAYSPSSSVNPVSLSTSNAQWIDSSPDQIMSNGVSTSQYTPRRFPSPTPTPDNVVVIDDPSFGSTAPAPSPPPRKSINFGAVALTNNNPSSAGQGVGTGIPGAGYLAVAGGFFGYTGLAGSLNKPDSLYTDITVSGGDMQLGFRRGNTSANEKKASNFMFATNLNDLFGMQVVPMQWEPVGAATPSSPAQNPVPWFGGVGMVNGINVNPPAVPAPVPPGTFSPSATNQVVYVGGSTCRDYLLGSSVCPMPTTSPIPTQTTNPGRYYVFGADPQFTFSDPSDPLPTEITMGGTPPTNAGMAIARGADINGNPLVVAWGGNYAPGMVDQSRKIYYLYNNSQTPTWGTFTVPAGSGPDGMVNSSLVYSHVTGKFYLYGGLIPPNTTKGDVWELSISSGTPGCGVSTSASCNFSWRLMDTTAGLRCTPSCPPARRSHRMVEANYNYFNSPNEPSCIDKTKPCSFGLFMSGGTPDSLTIFGDRWIFDPTANAGGGLWIKADAFPARTFSALAPVEYSIPSTSRTVHRAVLFGGETGMANPSMAKIGNYFVPPTLGDTWMFDYDSATWHLVRLLGRRFDATLTTTAAQGLSKIIARSSAKTNVTNEEQSTRIFAPPPLSGSVMITRTARSSHLSTETPKKLAIPEVFLFGGRDKTGAFHPISNVYKFCAGTTGERPVKHAVNVAHEGSSTITVDDASCDGYDETENPSSTSPVTGYVGRWLPKTTSPLSSNTDKGAYLAAGVYDSSLDYIIMYGGIRHTGTTQVATDLPNFSGGTDGRILQYTPPSRADPTVAGIDAEKNGVWSTVDSCAESPSLPVGRYGHSMGYDPITRSIIVVGGYDLNGNLLTQTMSSGGKTQSIPEVWTATRFDAPSPGLPNRGIPAISNGENPFPCYYWAKISTFGNSLSDSTTAPPVGGIAHAASIYIPSSGYNTGYYTMFDESCVNAGPIATSDSSINKLLVGGAYFDIDRTKLGVRENLILNLTFIPLGPTNQKPDQSYLAAGEAALFRVHLVRTGQSGDVLRQVPQPRDLTYAATDLYPQVAQSIAVIAPPTGQIRQEQVFIPLSIDPAIDRIRVERYSGSAILLDASIFRTGQ